MNLIILGIALTPPFVAAVISTFSPLLPVIVYVIKRRSQPNYFRYVAFLLAAGLLCDTIGMSNSWVRLDELTVISTNVYFFIYCICVVCFYRELFPEKFRKSFFLLLPVPFAVWLYEFIAGYSDRMPYYANVAIGIIVIILSLSYFYRLITEMPTVHIQDLPLFWLNTAFLIYHSSTLILFLVTSYFHSKGEAEKMQSLWIFHNLFNLSSNILFAIGLWRVAPKIQST